MATKTGFGCNDILKAILEAAMQRFNARKQRLRTQRVQPRVSDITSLTIIPVGKRRRGRVRIRDLRPHHCRYGFGDPRRKSFRFCGEQRVDDAPYCAYHCSVCYQPLR